MRNIITYIFLLISISVYSQIDPANHTYTGNIKYKPSGANTWMFKDSIIKIMMKDTIPNTAYLRKYVSEHNSGKTYFDYTVCPSGCDYNNIEAALLSIPNNKTIYIKGVFSDTVFLYPKTGTSLYFDNVIIDNSDFEYFVLDYDSVNLAGNIRFQQCANIFNGGSINRYVNTKNLAIYIDSLNNDLIAGVYGLDLNISSNNLVYDVSGMSNQRLTISTCDKNIINLRIAKTNADTLYITAGSDSNIITGYLPKGFKIIDLGSGNRINTNVYCNYCGSDSSTSATKWYSDNPNYQNFSTSYTNTSHKEGRMFYNNQDKVMQYNTSVSGVSVDIGQELHAPLCINKTTATMYNGDVVYLKGFTGNKPNVYLANAKYAYTSDITIGVVTQDSIPQDSTGYVTTYGVVHDLNTNIYSNDTLSLFLDTINGKLTQIEYQAPIHRVRIGTISRKHASQGSIIVGVNVGERLSNLHDVKIATPVNNQLLTYETSSGLWKNKTATYSTISGLSKSYFVFANEINKIKTSSFLFADTVNSRLGLNTVSPLGALSVYNYADFLHVTNIAMGTGLADGFYGSTSGNDILFKQKEITGKFSITHGDTTAIQISHAKYIKLGVETVTSNTTTPIQLAGNTNITGSLISSSFMQSNNAVYSPYFGPNGALFEFGGATGSRILIHGITDNFIISSVGAGVTLRSVQNSDISIQNSTYNNTNKISPSTTLTVNTNAGNMIYGGQDVIGTGAINTISLSSGGSGYAVGNVVSLSGGTEGQAIVVSVSSGVVTVIRLLNIGSGYTTGVKTTTALSGTGTGLTINITAVYGTTTNKNGGNTILQTGIGTGNTTASLIFKTNDYGSGGSTTSLDSLRVRMTIDTCIKIANDNSATNNLIICPKTGDFTLNGTFKRWDDFSINSIGFGNGLAAPSLTIGFMGSDSLAYIGFGDTVANDCEFYELQMPHRFSNYDSIDIHLHDFPTTTPVAGDTAVWQLVISYANVGSVFSYRQAFIIKQPLFGLSQWQHSSVQLYLNATASGGDSRIFNMSLTRLQNHTSDTYTNTMGRLSLDGHGKINTFGSPTRTGTN